MGRISWPKQKPAVAPNLNDPRVRHKLRKEAEKAVRQEQRRRVAQTSSLKPVASGR